MKIICGNLRCEASAGICVPIFIGIGALPRVVPAMKIKSSVRCPTSKVGGVHGSRFTVHSSRLNSPPATCYLRLATCKLPWRSLRLCVRYSSISARIAPRPTPNSLQYVGSRKGGPSSRRPRCTSSAWASAMRSSQGYSVSPKHMDCSCPLPQTRTMSPAWASATARWMAR